MAGFADAFSQESIGSLLSDPRMLLGLAMLQQSGPQAGNPGFGARLGQALGGTATQLQQLQHSQALQQYRRQMIEAQQADTQLRQQAAQAKADQQRQYQERLQDPDFLNSLSPMARQLAALGANPADLVRAMGADNLQAHRQASLAQQQSQFDTRQAHQGGGQPSGPRTPAPRSFVDEPLGDDMYQRHQYDPATGGYQAFGKPFNKHSQRKAASPAEAAEAAILGAEPPAAGPDLGSLPGNAPLSSYMPQQQEPIGVRPMTAAGSVPGAAHKPGTRTPGKPKIAEPLTKADYDALPSGTQYLDPASGRVATKR